MPSQRDKYEPIHTGTESHHNIIERWPSIVQFGLQLALVFLYWEKFNKEDTPDSLKHRNMWLILMRRCGLMMPWKDDG